MALAVAAFAVPATAPPTFAETPDPSDPCTINGTPGPDVLTGTPGDDVICGGGGNDDLSGLGGDDLIRGGNGDDTVNGNEGHDYLNGGNGTDTVSGGAGDDHLNGSAGDDTVTGDAGNDDVRGGDGVDSLSGGDDDDILRSRDGGTVDSVVCGAGVDDEGYADLDDTIDADCEFRKFLDLTPPTAVDDAATVTEDDPATIIRVRVNDTDPDAGTKQIDSATQPANGTVVIGAGKATLTYQPNQDYCNAPPGTTTDDFTYTLTPGGSTADVRVTVTCVDDAPVAVDDTKTITEDDAATTIDVLANDTDVEGDPFTVVDPVVSQPAAGVVAVTNGGADLTYTPNANFCNNPPPGSTDDFSYALDPGGDTADVHVTVSCANDGPVADDESFTATAAAVGNTVLVVNDPTDGAPTEAGPHKVVSGDILDGDVDIDGPAPLTVTAETVSSVDGGSAVIEADGDFVFTPAAGTSCTDHSDSFDYEVGDGDGGTDTGTVTIETTGCVWYVDNSAAADGGGTSNAAFDTLAEAEASSAANDTIYVYDGDNTTTGYATGITLKAGQRLLGELAGLAIGGDLLATGTAGKRPTLTASGVDVVTLGAGNTIRGVEIDPAGAGGIYGSAGDINGIIVDVRIVDNGAGGTEPGLELDGTTGGTYNVSDLTVSTVNATGIRLNNAGTVAFADAGTISVTTSGARALELSTSNLGASVFDTVTVTGSTSGGVAATTTGGSLTFGNLSLTTTSGTTPAFFLSSAAGVTVPASGTATVNATGGPAVDVNTAPDAVLSFDSVSSANSTTDGINLDGLVGGTFSAPTGAISGATGIAFDLNGGTGDITYGGTISNGTGSTAEVTGRSGGTVTFSGTMSDNSDSGGGISLATNTGGTTLFSASTVLDTQTLNAVSMTTSDGHTLRFTGGLTLTTTSGRGFNADASGTVAVTGASNTITSNGGGRALSVVNTDIGVDDLTFRSISASGGGSNGIVLDATGSGGNLVVTGSGGTCTIADTTGCSGGTIAGVTGGDDTGTSPVGTAIVLRNTTAPSFTRIRINGATNYGIRGTNVAGLTLVDSVVHGALGTTALTANKDGGLRFEELTGTVTMTNVPISGGYFTNLMVDNTAGSLNATLTNVDSLALVDGDGTAGGPASGGDDAVQFEGIINADMNVVYTNSQFTTANGDVFQYIADGSGGGDLDFTGNTVTNNDPSIFTGGGGVAIIGGARGPVTLDILNNSFRDSKTNALTIIKSRDAFIAGTNNLVANISNNTIGVAATANSGSAEGDGMEISTFGDGNATYNVTNNDIRQYNSSAIQFTAGGGVSDGGQLNLKVSGNSAGNPGTNPLISLFQGIRVDSGVIAGDAFATCVDFDANSITGSSDAANRDFRLSAFQSPIRQPGYAGGPNDEVAFAAYAASLIGGGAQGTAFDNPPQTFSGTGTSCP